MGPTQGVQPAPKAMPRSREPARPRGEEARCTFFSKLRNFQKLKMKFRPSSTTRPTETRFTTREAPLRKPPAPLNRTPSATNTAEKPATNSSVRRKTGPRPAPARRRSSKAAPPIRDR